MKKKRKLLIGLLVMILMGALTSISARADAVDFTGTTSTELQTAINSAASGSTIVIKNDITFTGTGYISISKAITLTADISSTTGAPYRLIGNGTTRMLQVYSTGALTLADITVNGNGGPGVSAAGPLTINSGTTITNCVYSNGSDYGGGGVRINAGGALTMNGGMITANTADIGGGIYSVGNVTLAGGIVSDNTASQYGGGVAVMSGSSGTLSGGTVSGNMSVRTNGGGVFVGSGSSFTVSSGLISGNMTHISSSDVSGGNGGGIFVSGGTLTMNGGEISGNEASYSSVTSSGGNGGGIYLYTGSIFNFNAGTITGNFAYSGTNGTATTGGNGGGVYAVGSTATLGNGTTGSGVISDNNAYVGGGVYLTGTSITIDGGTILNNTANEYGGGIVLITNLGTTPSIGTMVSGTISGNVSIRTNGGGVFVGNLSGFTMDGGEVNGNKTYISTETSGGSGGGVYVSGGGSFTLNDGRITSNEAAYSTATKAGGKGGGVFISGASSAGTVMYGNGTFTMTGGTVSNNIADYGAGVYISDGIITDSLSQSGGIFSMTGGAITGNTADVDGGGVFAKMGAESSGNGIFTTLNSGSTAPSLTDNSAPNGNGGAIYTSDLTYSNLETASTTIFSSNSASKISIPPADANALYPNIGYVGTSTEDHPLNNYDINITTATITYDANGGTGSYSETVLADTEYTVLSPTAVDISHLDNTFMGWNTAPNGTGEQYQPDDTFVVTEDITLYAQWQTSRHSVESELIKPYVYGYPDGTFRPENSLTRAETAQMIYNLMDLDARSQAPAATAAFPDVSPETWYYEAVMYLKDAGIIAGYPDGSFHPDQAVTRAEFTTMIVLYEDLPVAGTASFSDVISGTTWAADYIATAENAKLVNGYPNGEFHPDDAITRAESVTILNLDLGRDTSESLFEGLTMPFSDVERIYWAWGNIMAAGVEHRA